MHVECARVAIVTVTPDTIQQLLPRDDAIRAACEHGQQREFFVREFDLRAVAENANIVEVDRQMIVFVRLAHCLVSTPHHGAHAGQQFAH